VETISWEPFDANGFAAYRIAMIALAGLAIYALFAILVTFAGERWALVGASVFALCPFTVHETSFTWPKLIATAWMLAAFLFVHQRRPFAGGLTLAVAYLFHRWPCCGPHGWGCGAWRERVSVGASDGRRGLRFSVAVILLVGPWMVATRLPVNLPTTVAAGQSLFLRYFTLADWQPATLETWLHTRWLNFANTFLPFWLYPRNWALSDINSAYHPAGPLVKFAFSWWNTLPLGLGLATWAVGLVVIVGATRRFRAAVLVWLVGPAILLTAYWGASPTGLMRERGHPLLAAMIGVAIVGVARAPGRLAEFALHRAVPWLQLPETFLMLWLTTLGEPDAAHGRT